MIIRQFEASDRDTFLQLCSDFYSSNSTIRPYSEENAKKTFARVLENHENLWGYMLIDSISNDPIGYSLVSAYWDNEEGGNVIVLDELYISPKSRHHGFAGKFIEWLENEFKDRAKDITLEVLNTNQTAQSLYRKEGLEPDGFTTFTKPL